MSNWSEEMQDKAFTLFWATIGVICFDAILAVFIAMYASINILHSSEMKFVDNILWYVYAGIAIAGFVTITFCWIRLFVSKNKLEK